MRRHLRAGADVHLGELRPKSAEEFAEPALAYGVLGAARRFRRNDAEFAGSAAEMVVRAAEPWSPATHDLFPDEVNLHCMIGT